MMTFTTKLQKYIEAWDFERRPVHCANCVHARVAMTYEPIATCAQGYGDAFIPLEKLLSPTSSTVFRPAIRCPDFEMADDAV